MVKKRLLGSLFAFLAGVVVLVGCSSAGERPGPEPPRATKSVLAPANVTTLEHLNAPTEAEKLMAVLPALRDNPEVRESLRGSQATVEFLPATLAVYDLYATVDAQLTSADSKQRITYYLQPNGGQWLIANWKKG